MFSVVYSCVVCLLCCVVCCRRAHNTVASQSGHAPHGRVDDLHDALVDALAHVDQRRASLAHLAQQEAWGERERGQDVMSQRTSVSFLLWLCEWLLVSLFTSAFVCMCSRVLF